MSFQHEFILADIEMLSWMKLPLIKWLYGYMLYQIGHKPNQFNQLVCNQVMAVNMAVMLLHQNSIKTEKGTYTLCTDDHR